MNKTLVMSFLALGAASVMAFLSPGLWPLPFICFVQNVSFTFVSRGRNSGSLAYHLVASIFSNGVYAVLLFLSIDLISKARLSPESFILPYALACMSGSVFAHWLALRVEKGKGRNVQEDRLGELEEMLRFMDERQTAVYERVKDLYAANSKLAWHVHGRPRTNAEQIREAWNCQCKKP
jgi:hypothetical protein